MTAPDAPRCPFCSSDAHPVMTGESPRRWWVVCNDQRGCGAQGPYRATEAEAIAAFCGKGER
jgi:hypothetical protein